MIKEDIQFIIDYLWEDEERHYEESEKPKDHIFLKLKNVKEWLDSSYCPLVDEEELEDE